MNERANPSQNEIWRHFKGGEISLSMPIGTDAKATKQRPQERLNGTHRI